MAEQTIRIGRRIAEARAAADLTQDELAAKIPGKANGTQLSKWERGVHRPGDDTLEQIAQALGKDVAWFLVPEPDKRETPDPFGGVPARVHESASQLDRIEAMLKQILSADPDSVSSRLAFLVDHVHEIRAGQVVAGAASQRRSAASDPPKRKSPRKRP